VIAHRLDLSFLKNPIFLIVGFSNILQGLGFFIPGIFLPSYASDLAMTSLQSTLVLSMFNLASIFGQIIVGLLSDRFGAMPPLLYSTLIGAGSVCFLWGFSKSFAFLATFSIVYGLTAGGYSVLWTHFASDIARENPSTQLILYGVFAVQRYKRLPYYNSEKVANTAFMSGA
jgi:MFS family permease